MGIVYVIDRLGASLVSFFNGRYISMLETVTGINGSPIISSSSTGIGIVGIDVCSSSCIGSISSMYRLVTRGSLVDSVSMLLSIV